MNDHLILVVDHDAFQRQLVDMLLIADQYQLHSVATAKEALDYLRQLSPSLIIIEAELADMAGADLCQRIKSIRRLHKVPVILVASPSKFKNTKEIAAAVGANLVLEKPLADKDLKGHVAKLIEQTKPLSQKDIIKSTLVSHNLPALPVVEKKMSVAPDLNPESSVFQLKHLPTINLLPNQARAKNHVVVKQEVNVVKKTEVFETVRKTEVFETVSISSRPETVSNYNPIVEKEVELTPDTLEKPNLEAKAKYATETKPSKAVQNDTEQGSQNTPSPKKLAPEQRPLIQAPVTKPPMSLKAEAALPHGANYLPPIKSKNHAGSPAQERSELELLRKQVEQLLEENEQLKSAVREFRSGVAVINSQSYLNAVEELEVLRRVVEKQEDELISYRRQGVAYKQADARSVDKSDTNAPRDKTWNKIVGGI